MPSVALPAPLEVPVNLIIFTMRRLSKHSLVYAGLDENTISFVTYKTACLILIMSGTTVQGKRPSQTAVSATFHIRHVPRVLNYRSKMGSSEGNASHTSRVFATSIDLDLD